ncbi:MAG: DUF2269 family protein [Acidimicrobiales bacterium]
MGIGTGLYNVVYFLHITAVIVGFGTVVLNGLYGMEAKKRQGPGGLAIMEATDRVGETAMMFIYAVPIFGILLIIVSDGLWAFSQLWVSLSFLFYLAGIGLSHGLLRPNLRKMQGLAKELDDGGPPPEGASGPPPQVAEMESRGRTVGIVSTVLNLNLVLLLILMIWKPGL